MPLVGHDRGGRAAHRMALDYPDLLTKLVILDIVPTYLLYQNITQEFATIFYHWFLLVQPPPFPETMVANSAEYFLRCTLLWLGGHPLTDPLPDFVGPAVFQEYFRTFREPATIHAICEDYRAAASIDLAHDKADLDKKIQCPLLVLWSEKGPFHRMYNVLQTWRDRAVAAAGARDADRTFSSGADAGGIDAGTQSVSAELRGFSSAGFSLWGLVLARTNPRRLKPAPLRIATKELQGRAYWYKRSFVPRLNQNRCVCALRPGETRGSSVARFENFEEDL